MKSTGRPDLTRRLGTRPERGRILIVTEGTQTEPQYFEGLKKHLRATGLDVVGVDVHGIGRDPERIVDEAARRMKAARREPYDEVWCVFDVDRHDLSPARASARRAGVSVAISNPCFEIWLLWHFIDQFASIDAKALKKALGGHGLSGKHLPVAFPYHRYVDAISRSGKNLPDDGYTVPPNPGSSVSRVASAVVGASGRNTRTPNKRR